MRATPEAARNKSVEIVTAKKNAPLYMLILKEWKEVPELGPFTERCVPLVEKLLPRLRMEYTKFQVPKVLLHDCDVYATKTDYQVSGSDLDTARGTCRVSARELGEQYMGDQNYKAWCENLHTYLTDQAQIQANHANRNELISEADRIRDELAELRKQYEGLKKKKGKMMGECEAEQENCTGKLPCCPSTCRPC